MATFARAGNAALTSQKLDHFVKTLAKNDRRDRRPWVADDDLVRAIRGYARCFTAATGTRAEIPHDEIASLIATYRHRRGLKPPVDASAQGVLFVAA